MQIRWIPNVTINALHVAQCAVRFPDQFVDQALLQSFAPYANKLHSFSDPFDSTASLRFWSTLLSSGLEPKSSFEQVSQTVRKLGDAPSQQNISIMTGLLTDLVALFKQSFPKFEEQIVFRMRPLQEQWDGYGQGILAHLKRITDEDFVPDDIRVFPLQPVLNGYSFASLTTNSVWIESVLTNPLSELPEVLRLAWSISQLHLDLPKFSEALDSATLARIAPLVMLPPILAASQVVEMSQCTNEMAALAVEHWHIPVPDGDVHDKIVPILMDWWETYLHSRPSWHVGMQALAKMLQA